MQQHGYRPLSEFRPRVYCAYFYFKVNKEKHGQVVQTGNIVVGHRALTNNIFKHGRTIIFVNI